MRESRITGRILYFLGDPFVSDVTCWRGGLEANFVQFLLANLKHLFP